MTSSFGRKTGAYTGDLAMNSLPGKITAAASTTASSAQPANMPRYGNMPLRASPAKGFEDFEKAGRIAVTNSSQGDDHSISSRGGVMAGAGASLGAWLIDHFRSDQSGF